MDRDRIALRDASTLWGVGKSFAVGRVIRERESGAGLRTIMRIGRSSRAWRSASSSRGIYTADVVGKAVSLLGCDPREAELDGLGRRIYAEKHAFKRREGFDLREPTGAELEPKA